MFCIHPSHSLSHASPHKVHQTGSLEPAYYSPFFGFIYLILHAFSYHLWAASCYIPRFLPSGNVWPHLNPLDEHILQCPLDCASNVILRCIKYPQAPNDTRMNGERGEAGKMKERRSFFLLFFCLCSSYFCLSDCFFSMVWFLLIFIVGAAAGRGGHGWTGRWTELGCIFYLSKWNWVVSFPGL